MNQTKGYMQNTVSYNKSKGNGNFRTEKNRKAGHPDLLAVIKNILIITGLFAVAVAVTFIFRVINGMEGYTSPVFVLTVLLVSRFTDGYIYGLAASVLGVLCVNYFLTYPYMELNFSISGYPLTFIVLLAVSLVTSTLTSRAKQRDQLKSENEREKVRTDLLRSISHDIRTPLTSIIGTTQTLLQMPQIDEQESRLLLSDVNKEAQWLLRMTENLLSVTKIEDNSNIVKDAWAVEETVGETAEKIEKMYPDAQLDIKIPETLLLVPMDPILIEQVLFNLIENAILHSGIDAPVQISVTEENNYAVFSVCDRGSGFSRSFLNGFRDGLIRADVTKDSDRKRNMGLGLRVSSAIVRAHKGEMQIRNTQQGAEVIFRLPLHTA